MISFISLKVNATVLGTPLRVSNSLVKLEWISLTTMIFYLGPQLANLIISFSGTYRCICVQISTLHCLAVFMLSMISLFNLIANAVFTLIDNNCWQLKYSGLLVSFLPWNGFLPKYPLSLRISKSLHLMNNESVSV